MEIAITIIIIAIASFLALKKFESLSNKTNDELHTMLAPDAEPRFYKNAGLELKKRGVDIHIYLDHFASLLESENNTTRFIGWLTIEALFPHLLSNKKLQLGSPKEEFQKLAKSIKEKNGSV